MFVLNRDARDPCGALGKISYFVQERSCSRPFVPLCNQDEAEAEEYAERCIILITRNLKMTALLKERQNIPKTHVPV